MAAALQIAGQACAQGGPRARRVAHVGDGCQQSVALEVDQTVQEFGQSGAVTQAERQRYFHRTLALQPEAGAGDDAEVPLEEQPVGEGPHTLRMAMRQR